jgi:hypothetical protein
MLQRTFPAGFIAPCLPTKTDKLPSGGQWLHEIKHDGFCVVARKDGAHRKTPPLQRRAAGFAAPCLLGSVTGGGRRGNASGGPAFRRFRPPRFGSGLSPIEGSDKRRFFATTSWR